MEFEPDISQLENAVTRLLEEYHVEKKKCEQLTLDLAESLARIEELKEEKVALLNEKEAVHSRVSTILGKLADWEKGLAGKTDIENNGSSQESGGQLFSMGASSS
jgi:FtsZ-binding cell division protein ZapB